MTSGLSSRERMLAALNCEEPDYVPCCFSAFQILERRCASQQEFVDRELQMGLDVAVAVAAPPVRHDPRVRIREWREEDRSSPCPVLHKEYETPAGVLRTAVNRSEDWPWGDHVPFLDDFLIPRSRKFLITHDDDLEGLRYLLASPTGEDVARLREQCRGAAKLADERKLITIAYYGMVGDVACWLAGISELIMMTADRPDFVRRLLAVIEEWNNRVMDVVLDQKVDVFVRRAWYENADVWAPAQYREFILPGLRRDAERAHRAGAKFGYLMSCAAMPLLDMMMDAGVDVLMGVDPAQDRMMDLRALKERTAGRMCLWGGVCGYLTLERGTPQDVAAQVQRSLAALAPGGGFILAPVTNVREDNARVWRNLDAMVEAWRSLRLGPFSSAGQQGPMGQASGPAGSWLTRS